MVCKLYAWKRRSDEKHQTTDTENKILSFQDVEFLVKLIDTRHTSNLFWCTCDVINGLTQKDISDGEIDEEIVSGRPRSSRAGAGDEEEEVAEDGDDDGHDVQRDPAPLVVRVQLVPGHR